MNRDNYGSFAPRNSTPAQKALATRKRNQEQQRQIKLQVFCREITRVIAGKQPEDMVALFTTMEPPKGCTKYDVFQMLDERPGLFGSGHFVWHSVLRKARNDRAIGVRLFDAMGSK